MNGKLKKSLVRVAERCHLTHQNAPTTFAYGWYKQYPIVITNNTSAIGFLITLSVARDGQAPEKNTLRSLAKTGHLVFSSVENEHAAHFALNTTLLDRGEALDTKLIAALDALVSGAAREGLSPISEISQEHEDLAFFYTDTRPHVLSSAEGEEGVASKQASNATLAQTRDNPMLGFLGALIGGVIGIIVMVALLKLNYVAALSGFILAGTTLGLYTKFSGRLSVLGFLISVVVMAGSVFVAHRVAYAWQIVQAFQDQTPPQPMHFSLAFVHTAELIKRAFEPKAYQIYIQTLVKLYALTGVGAIIGAMSFLRVKRAKRFFFRLP